MMIFSQKRTCNGCVLGESECKVKKVNGTAYVVLNQIYVTKIPVEPCFKPKTRSDIKSFSESVQNANLEIFRCSNV
jgi:hypothetical protein